MPPHEKNDLSGRGWVRRHSDPILSVADAAAWEKRLLTTEEAEWAAMLRAGAAVAAAVEEDSREIGGLPPKASLLVLVGKGHNGGDALLAAAAFLDRFPAATVSVVLVFGEEVMRPLARRALETLRRHGDRVRWTDAASWPKSASGFDVCLDGIFGFQFRPPVDEATGRLIEAVNASSSIALQAAIDLPSGLGGAPGAPVFRADFTYATGIVKSAVASSENVSSAGRVRYLDLGFFPRTGEPAAGAERVLLPSLLEPLGRIRPAGADKRTYGHVVLVGGSRQYPGAILMAAEAAVRGGVGLATAWVPDMLVPEYAARLPEVMWNGWPTVDTGFLSPAVVPKILESLTKATALLVGPGLGAEKPTTEAVRQLIAKSPCPAVCDADALRPEVISAATGRAAIATPHAGEFQRMANGKSLRDFCRETGIVVTLKGPRTRICDGEEEYFSFFGGPVLSRGGSGDLLAGLTAGLLAQFAGDLVLAATQAVAWHGQAADLLAREKGQVAVHTTQLLDYLPPVLRRRS
ncbi:MAG TPA: NAD(P)H-hydrate dehydratase [Candidatus Didemnitutus sp.]|jgi:NAD(P)H-hydrate epimerase